MPTSPRCCRSTTQRSWITVGTLSTARTSSSSPTPASACGRTSRGCNLAVGANLNPASLWTIPAAQAKVHRDRDVDDHRLAIPHRRSKAVSANRLDRLLIQSHSQRPHNFGVSRHPVAIDDHSESVPFAAVLWLRISIREGNYSMSIRSLESVLMSFSAAL